MATMTNATIKAMNKLCTVVLVMMSINFIARKTLKSTLKASQAPSPSLATFTVSTLTIHGFLLWA